MNPAIDMLAEFSGMPRRESPRVLTISRAFDAPRAAVWDAWADAARMRCWMGPHGFTATHREGSPRPGDAWRLCLVRDATGEALWQGGVYLDVVPPERMAFSFAWDDAQGRPGRQTLVTVTLSEKRGRTTLHFRQEVFETVEDCAAHREGWNSSFDRLAEYIGGATDTGKGK